MRFVCTPMESSSASVALYTYVKFRQPLQLTTTIRICRLGYGVGMHGCMCSHVSTRNNVVVASVYGGLTGTDLPYTHLDGRDIALLTLLKKYQWLAYHLEVVIL